MPSATVVASTAPCGTTQTRDDFPAIGGIVAEQLAQNNYHFSPNARTADLLITIHWGRTSGITTGGV
ncbi:MAG: hypothetical protein J6386_13035 [Candidatus Synoicihabitans palmerolidicus]|nr:hypothetical protein [Candidatus Synoicihabitans palmerolidicus]